MDWLPIISTLGVFIVAAVNVYLNYKARTQPRKQRLYSKQLVGYIKIFNALTDFYIDGKFVFCG